MAKDASLLSEIHRLIGDRMEANRIAHPGEIVDEIFRGKPLTGPHADFYRAFARREVVGPVTRILKRVGMTDDPASPQMVLPGHTRLDESYPVLHNGERSLVPIGPCTRLELSGHVSLLRKQAKGCENHAGELERYLATRMDPEGDRPEAEEHAREVAEPA